MMRTLVKRKFQDQAQTDLPSSPLDDGEDISSNPSQNPTLNVVLEARVTRRDVIQGAAVATGFAATSLSVLAVAGCDQDHVTQTADLPSFKFPEVVAGVDERQDRAQRWLMGT